MKLMIVDDHAGVRAMIHHLVASPGDLVRECASGAEALRMAREFQPDYATVDIRMPDLDGFATTRGLRALCAGVRVVIVSAFDQPELRTAATAAGATGYVVKEELSDLRSVLLGQPDAAAGGARAQGKAERR